MLLKALLEAGPFAGLLLVAARTPRLAGHAAGEDSAGPERKLRKKLSTSRESVSAMVARSSEDASTLAAAVLVSPIASRKESILVTRTPLPLAADWALAEISRVA